MGMKISVVVEAQEPLDFLAFFNERMSDMSEFTSYVALAAQGIFRENIQREYGGAEGDWAPLAQRTVEDRIRHGYGGEHPMLQRTKTMLYSITSESGPGWAEAGPDNRTPYARNQDTGETIPMRSFVHVDENDLDSWIQIAADWLTGEGEIPGVAGGD